jgi:magnesium transporter
LALSAQLVDCHGARTTTLDADELDRQLAGDDFFWLDLHQPDPPELELLGRAFGFHPLALEDSEHFGQRPKLEEYDDFVFLVVFGWAPDEDGLAEVHCFYSERYLVTVHRDDPPAFDELRARFERRPDAVASGIGVLYRVVDALVDSFSSPLARFDERLTLIETAMLEQPTRAQLQDIFTMRRRLVTLQRAVVPQRDLFARLQSGAASLPGLTPEAERYFRDVYDHLLRLGTLLDGYRELMTSAVDAYMSTSSNRMNGVMKQLAVVATIFLPLTFVTGFFGQNFGWMVDHVDSWPDFVALGIGSQLVTVFLLVLLFRRQGWLS